MVDVIIGIIIIMCVESKLRLYTDYGTGDVININGLVHLCKTDKWQRRIWQTKMSLNHKKRYPKGVSCNGLWQSWKQMSLSQDVQMELKYYFLFNNLIVKLPNLKINLF